MWKSLYNYNGEFPGSLSFKEDENFLILRKENEYWYLVARPDGLLGCVPVNYLAESESQSEEKDDLLAIITTALKSLNQPEAAVLHHRDDLIKDLLKRKSKLQSPPPSIANPPSGNKIVENNCGVLQPVDKRKAKRAPPPPQRGDTSKVSNQKPVSPQPKSSNTPEFSSLATPGQPRGVHPGLAFRLVEALRVGTGANHSRCTRTLRVLLDTLTEGAPDLRMWTDLIEGQLDDSSVEVRRSAYEESVDWAHLDELFEYFEARKNDSQERSWSLHEDETMLARKLEKLVDTLTSADECLVRARMEEDQFHALVTLIQLYQMEQRVHLRRLLLRFFVACCEVEPQAVPVCLYSVLPLEIIRDLSDSTTEPVSCTLSLLLLTLLVTSSEELPVELNDKLTPDFVYLLLAYTNPPETSNRSSHFGDSSLNGSSTGLRSSILSVGEDTGRMNGGEGCDSESSIRGDLPSAVTAFLLAFNRHLPDPSRNILMHCLKNKQELARHFMENVIQAFNRGDDPAMLRPIDEKQGDPSDSSIRCNSVRKLLCDIYADPETADLIYRNDADVIIDVINRQLCDLPIDSPGLSEYLVLLDLMSANSDYISRGAYKISELCEILRRIQLADDEASPADRDISEALLKKLSHK